MVRNAGPLFRCRFGRADVELLVDGDGIAIDNFALKLGGKFKREGGLSTAGRAEDHDQQRIADDQRALQLIWCHERVTAIAIIRITMMMRPIVSRCWAFLVSRG